MRKALIIGVDYYLKIGCLFGCVKDAHNVNAMLERDADGSRNFHTRLITGTGPGQVVKRAELRKAIQELFNGDSEVALLYFAGHGYIESSGGYLCTSDTHTGDDGVSLSDIMTWANKSTARSKVVILDSCHSGVAGDHPVSATAELSEGLTILTASTAEQYATEENGSGVFTTLLIDALGGAAANLVGEVTPGSVYAHIDQSLGAWAQRPMFKTNVKTFVSLRRAQPSLELEDLRKIADLFPEAGHEYALDPSFEPMRTEADMKAADYSEPDPKHTAIFSILQKYNRVNLVIPVGAPHMWHAAMESKACRLTALGEHYRRLVADGMI